MDDGNVKEIATPVYWIPEMKCRLFSLQSFFGENGGDNTEDYKFMVEESHVASSLEKV